MILLPQKLLGLQVQVKMGRVGDMAKIHQACSELQRSTTDLRKKQVRSCLENLFGLLLHVLPDLSRAAPYN